MSRVDTTLAMCPYKVNWYGFKCKKRKIRDDDNITRIYRVANENDIEKWEEAKNREVPSLYRCRQIIQELGLKMKLSDVEFQADNSKATFYYSADERVDFRELIKLLAGEFKIRVEMRQISLRQEAGRLGGIGVCGRELCCSTWLVDFKNVSTSAARYQRLSLNPAKLSGQCGRLKCCLNYELDTYIEAIKHIPNVERPLQTEQGPAKLQKTDIFRRMMWFSYNNDNDWHSITCDRVNEILELNDQGKKVFNLQVNESTELEDMAAQSTLELELLDKKFTKKKKKKKNRNRPRNPNQSGNATNPQKETSKPQNTPQNKGNQPGGQAGQGRRKKILGESQNRDRIITIKRILLQKLSKKSPENGGNSGNSKRKFPPRRNQKPNDKGNNNE